MVSSLWASELEEAIDAVAEAIGTMIEDQRDALGDVPVGYEKAPALDLVAEYLTIRTDEAAIEEWLTVRAAGDGWPAAMAAWLWYEHHMTAALDRYGGPDGVSAAMAAREQPAVARALEAGRQVMEAPPIAVLPAPVWDGPAGWLTRQGGVSDGYTGTAPSGGVGSAGAVGTAGLA